MSKETDRRDADKQAREYIDRIAAINRRHGMGDRIPAERYDRAVEDAARVFKTLRSAVKD
jgi:hypothetical protein